MDLPPGVPDFQWPTPMRLSKAAQNAGVSMESIVAEPPENAKEEDILTAD